MDMTPIQQQAFDFYTALIFAGGTIVGSIATYLIIWLQKGDE